VFVIVGRDRFGGAKLW